MRIAVAHEWLTNWAGSERVAAAMASVSDADQLVSAIVDPEFGQRRFAHIDVRALWTSRLPHAQEAWSRYAIPMMAAWATARVDADALLVSSHFAAHGATVRFKGPSIVYYHTPARLVWRPDMELDRIHPRAQSAVAAILPALRKWDRWIAQHPTVLLANSTAVAKRIQDAYGRPADVLYPPVALDDWLHIERREPTHLLMVGRLVAYKRPWIGVEAARMSGLPLLVIGDGPERARLESQAPSNVHFAGHVSHSELQTALSHASALLFPGEEDFGIAPVEALAAGIPVVAYAAGGAMDYMVHGHNGLLVRSQDPESFAEAAVRATRTDWDVAAIRRSALPYGVDVFRTGFRRVLDATLGTIDHSRARPNPMFVGRSVRISPWT
jgi:glycosyltransferase involved in cell wall biosynthesis